MDDLRKVDDSLIDRWASPLMATRTDKTTLPNNAFVEVAHGYKEQNEFHGGPNAFGTALSNETSPSQMVTRIQNNPNIKGKDYVFLDACDTADCTGKAGDGPSMASQVAKGLKMPVIGATGDLEPPLTGSGDSTGRKASNVFQVYDPTGSAVGSLSSLSDAAKLANDTAKAFKVIKVRK